MTKRVALVTGGMGGLGTALCRLHRDGLRLVSEHAGCVTGAKLAINGGQHMC